MGGGESTQQTDSQSVSQIPQWMNEAGQQNYAQAQNVAATPLQQYQGQMVADTAPQTQQMWNLAAQAPSVGQGQYAAATAGDLNALGSAPTPVTAGQLSNTDLSPYMNPFTNDVIDTTKAQMLQTNALSQDQAGNAASSAGAFGGSRQGIQQGQAQAQGAMNIGQMVAQLQQANFQQAQAGATGDINRNLQADTTNQGAAQAKINSDILASQGLQNTGTAMNNTNVANAGLLTAAGASQSMQAQSQINAQMAKFNEARNYPTQQLGVLESSLGMTPHDTSTSGDSTTTTTTPTDWSSILSGGLGAASGIMKLGSDKKLKKNITSMGSDPMTGIPIKSYNFKGEAPGAQKTVGPLAQDVEKAMPGSTSKVKGVLAMTRPKMVAATPSLASSPLFAGNTPKSVLSPYMPGSKAAGAATTSAKGGARSLHGLANTKRKPMGVLSA